jgi:hypothetical protein
MLVFCFCFCFCFVFFGKCKHSGFYGTKQRALGALLAQMSLYVDFFLLFCLVTSSGSLF